MFPTICKSWENCDFNQRKRDVSAIHGDRCGQLVYASLTNLTASLIQTTTT